MVCAVEYFDVVISQAMLDELRASLSKRKHLRYAKIGARMGYYDAFASHAILVEVTASIRECRDPKDDKVLELAASVAAPIIVSGDQDLLIMNPFRGIEILSPRQFVDEFS